MKQPGARVGRLAVRAMLALAAVGCAVPAYRYAEVAALRTNAPLDASRVAPHDAKALASALGSRFDSNPEFKPSTRDIEDIRSALVGQPLETKLLGILGLTYEASGDPKRAAETMRVASRASRRDVVSQLYLIESASASGDVKATLRHYNAALSTQPELNTALLPILSAAITYPEIRSELRPYLQLGEKWVPAFLTVAAEKGTASDLGALLLPLPKTLLSAEYAPALTAVFQRIALDGDRKTILRFVRAIVPGFEVNSLTDLSPQPATLDKRLGQFAWTFPAVEGIVVEIGGDRSLRVTANPLTRGVVAARNLLVESGANYQFDQTLETDSKSIDARWNAMCITPTGTVEISAHRIPVSEGRLTISKNFTIPSNCKVMRLTLTVTGPDSQIPESLVIKKIQMKISK